MSARSAFHATCQDVQNAVAKRIAAATGEVTIASHWVACHCCGKSFPAENLVNFADHPEDGICVVCVEWLHDRSRPIARRLNPIWQLHPRVRTWFDRTR
jgi:uncharacterized paraquat-inducible protein A